MTPDKKSMRTPLAKARVFGSAKSGFEHWYRERLSALIAVPTGLYMLVGFLNNAVSGGYSGTMYWLQSPFASTMAILFLLASLVHVVCGLEVVMSDYIHDDRVRLPAVFALKFIAAGLAVVGTLSIAKIFLGV